MQSMTGFGSSRLQAKAVELDISIRSINGRFLDCRFHLPKEYVPFENELKKIVSAAIERGVVDIYVNRKVSAESSRAIRVQKPILAKWLKALSEISKQANTKVASDPISLANLDGVIKIDDASGVETQEEKALFKTLTQAVKACAESRLKEGIELKKEILKWVGLLEKSTEEILKVSVQASQELKKRLEDKWKTNRPDVQIDDQRVAQEVLFYLDKGDISEEIARLRVHLKNFRDLSGAKEANGKKLDFYTQELLREVNTIGSKSNHPVLTGLVVDAKSIVEKIREQVQNIE